MSSLFSKPKVPKPTPAEPAPSPITVNEDRVAQETQDRLRRRRGRAATLLSGGNAPASGTVAIKTALGS